MRTSVPESSRFLILLKKEKSHMQDRFSFPPVGNQMRSTVSLNDDFLFEMLSRFIRRNAIWKGSMLFALLDRILRKFLHNSCHKRTFSIYRRNATLFFRFHFEAPA